MKALVVYESMFGNTEEVARAIADGLGESVGVQLAEVSDAPVAPNPDLALIVVGGPTHAFSTSWTSTRVDAINRGATEGETEFGLREWMASLPSGQHTAKIATFGDEEVGSSNPVTPTTVRPCQNTFRQRRSSCSPGAE